MQTDVHHAPSAGPREEPNAGLMWFTQECLDNHVPLESYVVHAERIGDRELAMFFRRALAESRRIRPGDRRRRTRRARDRGRR